MPCNSAKPTTLKIFNSGAGSFSRPKSCWWYFPKGIPPLLLPNRKTSSTSMPTSAQIPLRVCVCVLAAANSQKRGMIRRGKQGKYRPKKLTSLRATRAVVFFTSYEIHSQERERRNASPRRPALKSFVAVSFSRYAELRLIKIARCVKRSRLENYHNLIRKRSPCMICTSQKRTRNIKKTLHQHSYES
jgi:hypothetical protein